MKVERQSDGTWRVVDASGAVLAQGLTNEQAWAFADRKATRPLWQKSKSAEIADRVRKRFSR